MKRSKKCGCGKALSPPGGPSSHFWHTAEGLFELCAACSNKRVAQHGEVTLPDVRFDFFLVGHGYQLDVYHDKRRRGEKELTFVGGSCRDFSGSHLISTLRTSLSGALLAQVDRWQRDPTRGTGKREQTTTKIHVNQHVIRSNEKTGARDPVLTVKQGKSNTYASEVKLTGPSSVVYRHDKPLSCGARVWIETTHPVEVVDDNHKSKLRQK